MWNYFVMRLISSANKVTGGIVFVQKFVFYFQQPRRNQKNLLKQPISRIGGSSNDALIFSYKP